MSDRRAFMGRIAGLTVASFLAEAMKMDAGVVKQELIAGFVPGVKLVPAHTMLRLHVPKAVSA